MEFDRNKHWPQWPARRYHRRALVSSWAWSSAASRQESLLGVHVSMERIRLSLGGIPGDQGHAGSGCLRQRL